MELWKDINGFEGLYQVSSLGNVKSIERSVRYSDGRVYRYEEKLLKPCLDNQSYRFVNLYRTNGKRVIRIHRLVAIVFIPNPENKPEVNHKIGDKSNNTIANLEWATRNENQSHAVKNKLHAHGEKHGIRNVLNETTVRKARVMKQEGYSYAAIARKFGINRITILQAVTGKNWGHIA